MVLNELLFNYFIHYEKINFKSLIISIVLVFIQRIDIFVINKIIIIIFTKIVRKKWYNVLYLN